MKKFIGNISFMLVVCALMAFTTIKNRFLVKEIEQPVSKEVQLVKVKPLKIETESFGISLKGHEAFLGELGHKESSNNYKAVNRLGYMGRYQFGKKTLKSIGINVTKQEFLSNPALQEEAMERLLAANYKSLKRFIDKYEGQTIHGVVVTKSGVLAAAHLGGAGAVRRWFRKGSNFKDANGTSITYYMKRFSGYRLYI
jgi:hypothetical protein